MTHEIDALRGTPAFDEHVACVKQREAFEKYWAEYTDGVLRTELKIEKVEIDPRILHAVMGISTEAGEMLDTLKKTIFYGKPLDIVNIREELGDLDYYVALLCSVLGFSKANILERNTAKLRARFPQGFTQEAALNRDLVNERKVLEDSLE